MEKLNLIVSSGDDALASDFNKVTKKIDDIIDDIKPLQLELGEGLVKKTESDKVTVTIDANYLGKFIRKYISDNTDAVFGPITYNVLEFTSSYVLGNDKYNWYDFSNTEYGIVRFTETAEVPDETTPNFGDKYIPSYIMNLSSALNLEETPYIEFEAITLNDCPYQFKLIDANGKSTNPIVFGNIDKTKELVLDTSTHQELKSTNMHTSSLYRSKYTNADGTSASATTSAAITNMISKLATEHSTNGAYDATKFANIKRLVDDIPGITFEEGFDKTNVTSIEVQMVEWCDKETITWKARDKAFIFNKFIFIEE